MALFSGGAPGAGGFGMSRHDLPQQVKQLRMPPQQQPGPKQVPGARTSRPQQLQQHP